MRPLTLEEATKVSDNAKEDGTRPQYFNSLARSHEEISSDFEVFLILTPSNVRTQIASFFTVILENDPNQQALRDELLLEFMEEELGNEEQRIALFEEFTEFYDRIRESYAGSVDGFTDVPEVVLLQEALTRSLGAIADQRDAHQYNFAVYSVLKSRQEAEDPNDFDQELRSWIRVLSTYD